MKVYTTTLKDRRDTSLEKKWSVLDVSLSRFFSVDRSQETLFSFYRDEDLDIQGIKHPINYRDNSVKIILTEIDNVSHLEYSGWISEPDKQAGIKSKKKEYKKDDYTLDVFGRIKEDPHTLFSYITRNGMGIRIAFSLEDRLNDDVEYISNAYYHIKNTFLQYDEENRFGVDTVCDTRGSSVVQANMCNIYWFYPDTEVYINEESKPLWKI